MHLSRNVEIKARLRDPEAMIERVFAIADSGPVELNQEDTYFKFSGALLKLRVQSGTDGQLIYYKRDEIRDPRLSRYCVYQTNDPVSLMKELSRDLGILAQVSKRRLLFHWGNVRIHIDDVKNRGWFLELEAVLSPGDQAEAGEEQVRDLMQRLGISSEETIAESYASISQIDTIRPSHVA